MVKNLRELLACFDNAIGVSGHEAEIAAKLKEEMEGFYDDWFEDALGNQIFFRKGKKDTKVLLAAHMDELGFMVSFIESDGTVRFIPIGLHDDRMAINQDLTIHAASGDVHGVTSGRPTDYLNEDEKTKITKIDDLFIDVGASNKHDADGLGIKIGDFISINRSGYFLNGSTVYTGKSVDDRSGLAVMTEAMHRLYSDSACNACVYALGSVQEELGIRGAGTAAHRIRPDVALAIDVTLAGDAPGAEPRHAQVKLGGGAAVKFFDWAPNSAFIGNAVPKRLTDALIKTAEENNIKYQREVLMDAGTDAWAISLAGDGAMAGAVSIPSRYIHSAVGTVDLNDMEACVELIVQFVKSL
ncbi:MAG: hypothetical protein FWG42_00990 [Clostridiales bacterium]|nr:hypothetical protein [Clostridiales bacterium]